MFGTSLSPALLTASLVVAMLGAYVSLGVAERTRHMTGIRYFVWLALASLALAVGACDMQVLCLRAMHDQEVLYFQATVRLISMLFGMLAIFTAFVFMTRVRGVSTRNIFAGAALTASAFAFMDLAGLAMMGQQVPVAFDFWAAALTILLADLLLTCAFMMWRRSSSRNGSAAYFWNSGSKLLTGLTIVCVQFTSRYAIHPISSAVRDTHDTFADNPELSYILGISTLVLFGLVHFSSYVERRDYTEKLEESEQRYKSLIEHNTDGIFALDLEGRFLTLNPAAERISGYRKEELVNRRFTDVLFPEDIEEATEYFQRTIHGEQIHILLDIRHRDGHRVNLSIQNIMMAVDGDIVGLFGVAQDITESKRTEDILRTTERLSVVGKLAAGMAHEIRNPLTALKGFTQILRDRGEPCSQYCDIMLSELDRIETIVSELLVLAKPQAASFQQRQVADILHRCIALLESQAILNNVQVRTVISGTMPLVWCEENHLKQVFINIIKNAIESMPSGGMVTISAACDQKHVVVEVMDEGCGIPEDHVGKLGEPFFTTKEKGTGLGLMVTSQIIRNHRGELAIHSELNRGTTITISLPLQPEDSAESVS